MKFRKAYLYFKELDPGSACETAVRDDDVRNYDTASFAGMTLSAFFLSFTFVLCATAADPAHISKVAFPTRDGQILKGILVKADNAPVVIMMHGLASGKEEWMPLLKKLGEKSWAVLAYDARGHGESSTSRDPNGSPDGYKYLGRPGKGSAWEKMIDDVGAAVQFIRQDPKLKTSPIYLCGASLGANVALNYATLSRSIRGLILLSPGLNYVEIKTKDAIQKAGNVPVLVVASSADSYAFESSRELKKLSPTLTFWSDVKDGHGVQMFDAKLIPRILDWLEKNR